MMNWTKMSALSEILSSIAVLATLIYLTIGIKQNTEALQAGTRQAVMESDQQTIFAAIDHSDLWLSMTKDNLTDAEKIRLSAYLTAFLREREFVWRQYLRGALDEETWISYQKGIVANLSGPQSRKWWQYHSNHGTFPQAFTEFVNGLLGNAPVETQSALDAFD